MSAADKRVLLDHGPSESCRLLAAEAIGKRLGALMRAAEGVRRGDDIECLHRMRVASRRLRTAMTMFEDCLPPHRRKAWGKEIRRLTKALGAARDKDVQIEFVAGYASAPRDRKVRPGVKRVLLRLRQDRRRLQKRVVGALDHLEASGVVPDISKHMKQVRVQARIHGVRGISADVLGRAYVGITMRLEEMLAYEPVVGRPECVQEHHAMRIAAKRLRYAMELFGPLYGDGLRKPIRAAKIVQTVLGDLHDCVVWVEQLGKFLVQERRREREHLGHTRGFGRLATGIKALRDDRARRQDELLAEFVGHWHKIVHREVWPRLVETLEAPLGRAEATRKPRARRPTQSHKTVRAKASAKEKTPIETEAQVEPEAPAQSKVVVEIETPVEPKTPVEAGPPVETEGAAEAQSPAKPDLPAGAEPSTAADPPAQADVPAEGDRKPDGGRSAEGSPP